MITAGGGRPPKGAEARTGIARSSWSWKNCLKSNPFGSGCRKSRKEEMNEKYPLVSDARDSRFLTLRSLQTSQGRCRTGLYIIEGVRHLARAVEHKAPIELVFLDPSILTNAFGRKLANHLRKRAIRGIRLSHGLYRSLTLAGEPQGIGAVLRQRWIPLQDLRISQNSLWLAIEAIESPGNLGTIVRTAEAAGVSGVIVLNVNCDLHDPATVRATMGSLFAQELARCSPSEFVSWARAMKLSIVASSPAGLMNFKKLRYRFPAVLLIGSEKRGLSEQLLESAHFTVRIPMSGGCDSINAAVAAGVLLFEIANQRHR